MITGIIHGIHVTGPGVSNTPGAVTGSAGNHSDSSRVANSPFGDLMSDAIGKVGELDDQARKAVHGLISGSGVDVHEAMIAAEKASMAFEMALAVRNKAVQSYQSVMGMQF